MGPQGILNNNRENLSLHSQQSNQPLRNENPSINRVATVAPKSTFWNQNVKPLYQHKVEVMNKADVGILAAGVVTAGALLTLGYKVINRAYFPIIAMVSSISVMGSCTFVNYRINQRYNEIAWDFINRIRTFVIDIKRKDFRFASISENYLKLKDKPEFKHLEEDLKTLYQQISEFQKNCSNQQLSDANFEDAKQTFQNYLDATLGKLSPDRKIEQPESPPKKPEIKLDE